jgi:8-oxo-dGTP diphosphatase
MKTIVVTAGLMTDGEKILLTQRGEGDDQELLWEFPGGQVEEGEEPRQALERELREELGIEAAAGELFDATFYPYPGHPVLLLVYRCRIEGGSPRPLGCRDLRWVDPDELEKMPMPPADEPIRNRLL